MADKHKGRTLLDTLEAANPAGMTTTGPLYIKSGNNFVGRLDANRYVVAAEDSAHTLAISTAIATSDIDGTHLVYEDAITADRIVTLTTAGAIAGMRWRVTRLAASTGAFNIDVGGLKNLAVSEWCEVVYDGTAWELAQFGAGV